MCHPNGMMAISRAGSAVLICAYAAVPDMKDDATTSDRTARLITAGLRSKTILMNRPRAVGITASEQPVVLQEITSPQEQNVQAAQFFRL